MKVSIEEVEGLKEAEVHIRCKQITPEILEVIRELTTQSQMLLGSIEEESFLIDPKEIYYIESIDDKVFAYTSEKMYQLNLKLYELEERLPERSFFRASKGIIMNISYIDSLKSLFNGRMQVRMKSGEYVIVSRTYVPLFKEKLGVSKK